MPDQPITLAAVRARVAAGYIEHLTPGTVIQPDGYRRLNYRQQQVDVAWLLDRAETLERENEALRIQLADIVQAEAGLAAVEREAFSQGPGAP